MQDLLSSLSEEVRRAWPFRWLGWLFAVAISGAGALTALLLPDIFTSTAQIVILRSGDQAVLPVHNAEVRFLNDETLDLVLNQVDLGLDIATPTARQRAKEILRSRINLRGTDTELFIIACNDRNPKRAKAVCDILLGAFRNAVATNADTTGLQKQLVEQQVALGEAEKRLQEYRVAHLDIFGQGGIETRLDTARAAEEKAAADYESALRRRDEFQRLWRASRTGSVANGPSTLAPPAGDPLIDRLYTAWTELETLRSRFSESHPDVILSRRQIESIVRQYPPDVRMCTRGVTAEASALLQGEEIEIDRPTVDATAANIAVCRTLTILTQAEQDVDALSVLSASAPGIQAEMNRLTAERDAARDRVENIRRRIQELDVGDPTTLYTVVSQPEVPRSPSSPNRPLLLSLVLAGALVVGSGVAYGRGVMAGTFVGPNELRRAFSLPFYGAISQANGLRAQLGGGAQMVTFLVAVGAIVAGLLILILTDPLLSLARQWAIGASASIRFLVGIH